MATKLSDIQLILLSSACGRSDGSLLPPPGSVGALSGGLRKSIAALLKRGLASEAKVADAELGWREEDGQHIGVLITDAGREAIGFPAELLGEDGVAAAEPAVALAAVDGGETQQEEAAKAAVPAPGEVPKQAVASPSPREGTKQALVVSLLCREGGASLDELVAATGWLPHTTRAALTGLRKKGHPVSRVTVEGASRYGITGGQA